MIGIYKITSPTGRIYIGQSINMKRRLNDYKNLRCKKQPKLLHSFLKYGYEAHLVEVILECGIEELNEKERYYQDLYDCVNNGLNCTLTKTNDKSGKLSDEHKAKISIANKNPSEITRLRKSNGQKGKVVPLEMRKRISESHKGKKHTIETRLKIAENSRNISEETRRKYVESHLGHKHTDEAKLKIAEASRSRIRTEEEKLKISAKHGKRVLNKDTGEVYLSVSKAALATKQSHSWLNEKLKGNAKNNTNLIFV